jgi:DNA modification methylase
VTTHGSGDGDVVPTSTAHFQAAPSPCEAPHDEPPAVAIAKTGDLWSLGEHRLLCGDSTSLEDVHRVMRRDKAALVATDPPYLVDYTGERPNDSGKDWTATYREIDIQDADIALQKLSQCLADHRSS